MDAQSEKSMPLGHRMVSEMKTANILFRARSLETLAKDKMRQERRKNIRKSWAGVLCSASLLLWLGSSTEAYADIIPPKNYAVTPSGINIADGSLQHSVTDLSIGTLTLQRYHRTGGSAAQPNTPPIGNNFSHNFDIFITASPRPGTTSPLYPIVHIGNRASGMYNHSPPSTSIFRTNLDAGRGQLSFTGSQYVYIDGSDASGTIYTFSPTIQVPGAGAHSHKIGRIDFPDGRRQTFSYNASGYLKLVEDSAGYAMVFDYNASGKVTAACAFNRSQTYVTATSTCAGAVMKVLYDYTSGVSVTDVMGQVTNYTMGISGVTCIKPPGYATCTMSVAYNQHRVTSQTLQDGGVWQTQGAAPDVMNDPEADYAFDCSNATTMTDPANLLTDQSFNKSSPCSFTDALGYTTSFVYEGAHTTYDVGPIYADGTFLREALYPEGNKYLAEYSGPFKTISKETMAPKLGSPLASLVKTYGYQSCTVLPGTYQNCAKPIWIKDPNLNQTDFTYASHGGVLTEMKPAAVAGGVRPLKMNTYVSKFAYIKNSGGTLVPAATATWVIDTETQCQTAAGASNNPPVCDNAVGAPKIVRTYQYGPNGTADNLLVRGVAVTADGETRRTCFGYDQYSRKISETKPRANLSVCP